MQKLIRKCFRYTQDKVKAQFGHYLIKHKSETKQKEAEKFFTKKSFNNVEIEEEDPNKEDDQEDQVSFTSDEREFLEN